ncbi:LANO_0H02410g1_1 [Lachancea nothofagi CBS 11611]|uniref:LANO_0H02410g1_1 n=1 Tax=Lachancea nothofagi CBS 11611 TaxID=1266666 RepID=A0A1G4KKY7_9SACH|nr:LANO_0H02410g1_1 [Lachancea nothofagi CBS 11611]
MGEFNETLAGQFPYLNNSRHLLLKSGGAWASAINFPYQVGHSFYSAIVSQYESQLTTSAASQAMNFGASAFVETAGYFFSNYAVGCFVTALVLNRIVAMSSLRSPSTVVRLPLWSRILFHGAALVTLIYNVWLTLRPDPKGDPNQYFALTYAIICLSHCIETFVTVTSNSKPMEEFDYSIFELSMHFYSLTRSNSSRADFVPDCLMALLGRLIIHIVELTNTRHYRLLCSTILNAGHLVYLAWTVFNEGFTSLPLLVKYRHIPKTLALACIAVSVACYGLAYLVRLSPYSSNDPSDLRFHSFMQNWYTTLNCTGEEEFTSTLINFAILICNPGQVEKLGIHQELSQLSHQREIHRSFLVSGYMNRESNVAQEIDSVQGFSQPVWQRKVTTLWNLSKALKFRILSLFKTTKKLTTEYPKDHSDRGKNLNDYVSDKNYSKFLARAPDLNANRAPQPADFKYMLPEDDWSADYVVDESILEHASECSDADSEVSDNSSEELLSGAAVAELILPSSATFPGAPHATAQEPQWLMSMWSILQCETQFDRRLTRSQYSQLNETNVLSEVMFQRSLETRTAAGQKAAFTSSERDLSCVVCKTNVRNIVLWPCKCFAMCEECRVSLGLRGFNTCICCRAPVKGYSKINTV